MIQNKLLKYILSIVLSALIAMHVSKWLFIGPSLNQLSIPVFGLMIYSIIKSDRKMYFLSFLVMGIVCIVTLKKPDDLTPAILFFVALLYYGNQKTLIISMSSIPAAYMINMFINQYDEFYNLPVGIITNAGILLFLYFAVIKQPSKINHLSKVTPLSCRQLLILKYLSLDIPRKQIVDKVSDKELWKYDIDNFTLDIINSEIAKIKKVLDIDSEFSLGVWYNKKTEIPE